MKRERVHLDEMNTSSSSYKVKNNRMRGALFGDQIEAYKDAFVHKGEYEIADAQIRPADEQWKKSDAELDFQMTFGRQTVIQRVNAESGPVQPEYLCIASVPRAGDPEDRYDVLGIVLYVEEHAREITTGQDRQALVREIVLSDHSSEQPLIISVWNDLAGSDCDDLSSWAEKFTVVGFTSLRATSHKGFSLTSSMSTMFVHGPHGDRAIALREWACNHQDVLSDRQARVLDVRNPSSERVIMTVDALKRKKNTNTLQEERCWIQVVVPEPKLEKVHAYLGCPNCGRTTYTPVGKAYTCLTCKKQGVISSPRITFNCEVSDGTDKYALTSFTEDSEKLFGMTAADLFRMKHTVQCLENNNDIKIVYYT
ncbi:replication protein A 70 kDa DNA-binding subunit B-like [Spinacia oleracea]|uniref:Replication protein A 70 kDa DNA-binding subunit B-like n=1 Tax=Spinacia oleracea TaxID=3562 RepID=A0ABM3QQB0_SPIOL|nr:replication protein A 70 kDa DNA-binding subunit B-like [Spinacia oleracea]